MITIHTITSTSQGKLHDNYEELCADALAQRDFLIRVTGFAALSRVLAGAKKLLSTVVSIRHRFAVSLQRPIHHR